MTRKLFAIVFLLALVCFAPLPLVEQATASTPAPQALFPIVSTPNAPLAASCSPHVCNLCAESGGFCTSIPFCHCVD